MERLRIGDAEATKGADGAGPYMKAHTDLASAAKSGSGAMRA